ncbi:MAG: sodium:calcium antiporter [Candidatus Limnocylindria bacterium]
MDIVLLVGALGLILVGAELFTNGIEWFGHRLNLAEGAVGSVLAAVATAMPETLIPVIAIVGPALFGGGTANSAEIGVGAILGAPFMLSTLAMFVTGVAVILVARRGRRGTGMAVNVTILGRDVVFFLVAYAIAIGTAFLPADLHGARWVVAGVLVLIYAFYVRAHFTDPAEQGDATELNRLHLTRLGRWRRPPIDIDVLPGEQSEVELAEPPALRIIVTQVIGALALIIVGAQVFVGAVEHLSHAIGLDPRILALVIAPIATELPEKFNSVIWVSNGKDTLAMGNITGAMVFQSCLPTVLGILFTEWTFQADSSLAFASAGAAFVATLLIFGLMLRRGRLNAWSLLMGGPIYAVYVAAALLLPVGAAAAH